MAEQTKKDPGAAATASGADIKSEGTNLHFENTPELVADAIFFWDRRSGSVEPFRGYPRGVAV